MHPYTSDARLRRWIYVALTLGAILSAWGVQQVVATLGMVTPWWFELPSVLGFFGVYWKWFDVRLWRGGLLYRFCWMTVPNLQGTWDAKVNTSHQGSPIEVQGTVCIEQTWSKLCVLARWPESESHSVSAALQQGPGMRAELTYTFVNEPKAQAVSTMEMHRGTAWLRINEDSTSMEGQYYSGRGRQQFGQMVLRRA